MQESIRAAGLLDISVANLQQLLAGEFAPAEFDLLIVLTRSGLDRSRLLSQLMMQTERLGKPNAVTAFGVVDGESVKLLRFRRGSLSAQCRCALDGPRLTRLTQIV